MSYGIQCFNPQGQVTYDTTALSWMLIERDRIIRSNETITLSYPHLAGYGFIAKALASPSYSPVYENLIGGGIAYHINHKISYSYSKGYPEVTFTKWYSHTLGGSEINKPVNIFIFVR